MIRFICPTCDKKLSVPDEKGGKIATCPGCKTRIIIPEAETEPQAESVTAEPPRRRSRDEDDRPAPVRNRRHESDDDEPPRRRRSEVDEDDDDDDFDRPRKRKKKKKRRRSSAGSGLPLGLDYFTGGLLLILIIALPVIGISFLVPPFAIVATLLGWGVSMVASVWFLIIAFQDDTTQGVLCLLVPCYSFIYLIQNFEEEKRPFVLHVVGIGITVLAAIAAGVGAK